MKSISAVILVSGCWLLLGSLYYPKWCKPNAEATISWDVSGYYQYLPALFIYHDIKQQRWMDEINQTYLPSPAYDQAFVHEKSGNKVNKYALGQAVLYSPFFFLAHAYATLTGSYPADGYSRPYQVAIWLGSLLVSIVGLLLLRRLLLKYFDERLVFWIILTLGLATNYMEYAAIGNGMNHTWLFTLMCALILFSIRWYEKADWTSACGIGISLGLSILIRPTEIIWVCIPAVWGLTTLKDRTSFLTRHGMKMVGAMLLCAAIVSIQSIYWKYASGEWVVYSYGQQGFAWLQPQIKRGLLGVNIGWWTYTPIMLLAMFGWRAMYKMHRSIFWPTFIVTVLAVYITISWSHFAEGGGLGQRNLIQIYPLMAFPLAMLIGWIHRVKFGKWIWMVIFLFNVYYTGWWVHQAHKGGFFQATQMTRPFFMRVVGRIHPKTDYFKLLDNWEYFDGQPKNQTVIWENDFETDTSAFLLENPAGGKAAGFNAGHQFYGPVDLPLVHDASTWIRLEADFTILSHEWEVWKYAHWIVHFYEGDTDVKTNFIRVQRVITSDQTPTHVFFDVKKPKEPFTRCTMTVWHAGSPQTLLMDNVKVSTFRP